MKTPLNLNNEESVTNLNVNAGAGDEPPSTSHSAVRKGFNSQFNPEVDVDVERDLREKKDRELDLDY